MTIFNEFVERRHHQRYSVNEGVFAALMPHSKKLGQIVDLGEGGLSFLYIDTGAPAEDSAAVDIYSTGNKFYLPELPINIVSDIGIPNKIPINPVVMRRQGVQFKKLTHEQSASLDFFIKNYTTREA